MPKNSQDPALVNQDEEGVGKGRRRAAKLLLSLDSDTSAMILGAMSERDVSMLSEEISHIGDLSSAQLAEVWEQFESSMGADVISVEPLLQQILEKALGKEKAKEMLEKIRRQSRDLEPFRSLHNLDARQIETIIKGEHPQVMAIVMSHLESAVANEVIKNLPEGLRYDVIRRIATTAEMPVEVVRQIDEIMEVRSFSMARQHRDTAGERRYKTVAELLNKSDPSVSKTIMERLTKELPDEASEIQALMFVFEDLVNIPDKDMQKVLSEIDKADLALALKAAPPEVSDKLLNNLSKRAREGILEEIELMGPKPLSDVEDAQRRILEQVRELEEKGDVTINRGGGEEMV